MRKTANGVYGRNFFIKLMKNEQGGTDVALTTQSRKLTVLLDTQFEEETERHTVFVDMFLRRK